MCFLVIFSPLTAIGIAGGQDTVGLAQILPTASSTSISSHSLKIASRIVITLFECGITMPSPSFSPLTSICSRATLNFSKSSSRPSLKVLGFAFDSREPSEYLPHTYIENTVCYTGTHDNMTTRQWFDTAPADAVAYAKEYMHLDDQEGLVWGTIRTAMSTVSQWCIVPLQDYLDLGAEGRMNFPGTMTDCNWTWRAKDGIMTDILAQRIHKLTKLYGRLGNQIN